MGGQFSTAEAQVFDKDGKLLASGRGHLFHRAAPAAEGLNSPSWRAFSNLGDSCRADAISKRSRSSTSAAKRARASSPMRELDGMANGVARGVHQARAQARRPGRDPSANRAEYLAAYFGIMRAGLVAVPVNFKFPRQTIHFIIKDAGAKFMLLRSAAAR
jgi:acyl-CoA synthetase (AMP-forming)/AMP-acid ligase II